MSTRVIPSLMRKWTVKKIVPNFREACALGEFPVPKIGPKEVLIRNRYVGINASDINLTAGRYEPSPVDAGIEGVGEVVQVGEGCSRLQEGQAVGHVVSGAFSEYQAVPEGAALPLPAVHSDFLHIIMSGIGPAIALDNVGQIKPGHNVLVTAAAGGAGQMAVQYAKYRGCNVVGTCSNDSKADFLKSLGCDRVVNYKEENMGRVLRAEYPKGIDVIFENVGGKLLKQGVQNIAMGGRVIIFGIISAYQKDDLSMDAFPNLLTLIGRCASMHGWFYFQGRKQFREYLQTLIELRDQGTIKTIVDNGSSTDEGAFKGLEDIPRAVEYLYSGRSLGKVVVDISD